MHARKRSTFERFVSGALALTLACSGLMSNVSAAAAASPTPPETSISAPAPSAPVTVVRELANKRTETSKDFEMSDGSTRTEIYSGPVNYKDSAGVWQSIDTTVRQSGTSDEYVSLKSQTKARFRSEGALRRPVHVERDGVAVDIDMVGQIEGEPAAAGQEALYLGAAPSTDVEYECLPSGIKQTVVVSTALAPSTFSFDMSITSGELRAGFDGSYGIYSEDATGEPVFTLGRLQVWDDAGREAINGTDASMTVVPTAAGARITYRLSRAWMADAARRYPVRIDPSLVVQSDTYVQESTNSGYPNSTILKAGRTTSSNGDDRRALLRFAVNDDASGIDLTGHYVQGATFQVWAGVVSPSCDIARLGTTGYWSPSVNWTSRPGYTYLATQRIPDNDWSYWDIGTTAQKWANYDYSSTMGWLQLYQEEDGSQQTGFYKEYNSNDAASYKPKIMITHEKPTVTVTTPQAQYVADESTMITATATVNTTYSNAVRRFELDVNGADPNTSRRKGKLVWTKDRPDDEDWVWRACAGGGYIAYETSLTAGGAATFVPRLERCSVKTMSGKKELTLVLSPTNQWGNMTSNSLDWKLCMGVGADTFYTATTLNPNKFDVLLPGPKVTATAVGASWATETDVNLDGVPDANDDASTGRGNVTLNWAQTPSATAYLVNLFDGTSWRQVANVGGTTTTWSTQGKGLYPKDSAIPSISQGQNPFTTTGGLDLRDDPRPLWAKTTGVTSDKPYYQFKVQSVAQGVTSTISSCPTITVQVPNRTRHLNDDPQHTSHDFGSLLEHEVSADLDTGAAQVDVTDLSIATWGPAAEISRHYASTSTTGSAVFATGWRFNYEQSLVASGTIAAYTDAAGTIHTFTRSGSSWVPPTGLHGTLTQAGDYTLTFHDGSALVFAQSTGALKSERDAVGNTTTYAAEGTNLRITADNGQSILVARDVTGRVSGASYGTADGTRTVAYLGGATPSVTYFYEPNDPRNRTIGYDYSGNLLSQIALADFPQAGQSATVGLVYGTADKLSSITMPGYATDNDRRSDVSYAGMSATATSYGKVDGSSDEVPISQVYTWNANGTCATREEPHTNSEIFSPSTFEYAQDNSGIAETSPFGRTKRRAVNGNGDVVFDYNEAGDQTSYVVNAYGQATEEVDAKGSKTTRTYVAAGGPLDIEKRVLDEVGTESYVDHDYNGDGIETMRTERQSASESAVITYGAFAPNGEPGQTADIGVRLVSGSATCTLVTTNTYSAFGDLRTQTDATGAKVSTNSYWVSGLEKTSSDASGTVTNHIYDSLGNDLESWRSNTTTATKADWRISTFDALGRMLSETNRQSTSGGGQVDQNTITHTYDALGREIATDDSGVSGLPSELWFDARGNQTHSWAEGLDVHDIVRSTRTTYDVTGQQTSNLEPGTTSASSTTVYGPDGQPLQTVGADGVKTTFGYDAVGNTTEESSTAQAEHETAFDLGGREFDEQVLDAHTSTSYSQDVAGRTLSAAGGNPDEDAAPSVFEYNTLSWVLKQTDADGIVTARKYDQAGRVTSETVGGNTTSTTYDGIGRATSAVDPDGRCVSYNYDVFGRVAAEVHSGTSPAKSIIRGYDSLGRMLSEADGSRTVTWNYATGSANPTTSTVSVGGITTGIAFDSAGLETSRSSSGTGVSLARTVIVRDSALRETSVNVGNVSAGSEFDGAGHLAYQWGTGLSASKPVTPTYVYALATGSDGRKHADHLPFALGGSVDASYAYTPDGRLASVDDVTSAKDASYTYDLAGNITGVSGGVAKTLTYDPLTSRLTSYSVGGTTTNVTFDASKGWRTTCGSSTLTYTGTGRLKAFDTPGVSGVDGTYSYDGNGQRTRSVVRNSAGTTTTTDWTYEGLKLHQLSSTRTDGAWWKIVYLYDAADRTYAGVYTGSDAASPITFTMVTTDRGDVAELLGSDGAAFGSYRYDPWGNTSTPTSQAVLGISLAQASAITSRQVLRYAGYVYDPESSLYYCSARHYDPLTMQFISKDPAKADGEASAYQYCGGNPVGMADPSGEAAVNLNFEGVVIGDRRIKYSELVLARMYPLTAWIVVNASNRARDLAKKMFPAPHDRSNRNAFQHAVWNAIGVKRLCGLWWVPWTARVRMAEFATAHETYPGNKSKDKEMDLYNNRQGRIIGYDNRRSSESSIIDKVDRAVQSGKMKVFRNPRSDNSALVSSGR